MSWALFTSIVDQLPGLQRAVLHGVGEPMLVKKLPAMVHYLKERGTYVLFNTNGTVLNERNGRALIEAGLDELRVSLDAANAKSYLGCSRQELLSPHPAQRAGFRALQEREGHDRPRVSAWLTGLKETIVELPAFVNSPPRLASRKSIFSGLSFLRECDRHARGRTKAFTTA